jgi:hypothetical protein
MLAVSIGAGILANYYTKTDAELIDDYLKEVERALEAGDVEKCMLLVHPRYHFEDITTGHLRRMCAQFLKEAPPRDIEIIKGSAKIAGNKATVYLFVLYLPKAESRLVYRIKSTWRLDLLKVKKSRPGAKPCWLAIEIRPIKMGEEPVRHLRDLRYCVVLR